MEFGDDLSLLQSLAMDGYVLLPAAFSPADCDAACNELNLAFARDADGSTLRGETGSIYGARNLLQIWPGVADVWRRRRIATILGRLLGPEFGLVRVLFFDKPPEQSWALPWHKDLTIAVEDNHLPSGQFARPTRKAGVPHVEAPEWLLEKMLTLRWHLDDMTEDNGPLKVIPGSHGTGKSPVAGERAPVAILGQRGDALLMRPLISHASNRSHEKARAHRRTLHFEFSGEKELPDGYRWKWFIPGCRLDSIT